MSNQIERLKLELNLQFPERRQVIDGVLIAVLCSEHVLLLGPPGTAKSALIRAIAGAFQASYFERLLTKFSTPEELFGPISLRALEQDRFARVVTGKLPEAEFAFVDEVFKANSSILNSLLSLMNERIFHNDGSPIRCPLVTLFGASNELPEGKELEAMFDRFLLRFDVDYLLRPASLRLVLAGSEPTVSTQLSMGDLKSAQQEVARVKVTDDTVDALIAIRDACKAEGIVASDRRWKKSLKAVQATAFMTGAIETCPEDLSVLIDSLWREPKERSKVARLVGRLADPVSTQATEVLDAARETAQKVSTMQNVGDRKDFITHAAQALHAFKQQESRLNELAKGAGKRAHGTISDALTEIRSLHAEMARAVSQGLGLGMRSVKVMNRLIFDVPRWSLFLHRDSRGLPSAEPHDDGLLRFGDELFERLYTGSAEPLTGRGGDARLKGWAEGLHQTCDQLPAFQRLSNEVRGDSFSAALATEKLLEELGPSLPRKPDAPAPSPQALRRMVGRGSEKAASAVEEARESLDGLAGVSWGSGSMTAEGQTSPAARTLADRLRQDQRLRRIAALAGRFKRIALQKHRSRVNHGADELSDIEQGADLGRLLPSELSRLTHPLQRLAFLRDFSERRCMQYQLRGAEALGKGPLVVCLDKSGSMDGARDVWATAVALALLEVARRERRAFALLCFDGAVKFETVVEAGGPLPEAALSVGCAGGTSIAAALGRGLDLIRTGPRGLRKSDVVLITDGGSDVEPAAGLRTIAAAFGASIFGLGIGVEADVLQPWCDEVQLVRDLDGVSDEIAGKLFTV